MHTRCTIGPLGVHALPLSLLYEILDEALEAETLERPHVSKGLVAPGVEGFG
jgi:hypothetical protein